MGTQKLLRAKDSEKETGVTPEVFERVGYSKAQIDRALGNCGTVVGKFRLLNSVGFTRMEISKYTGKRYQQVRNQLNLEVKVSKDEVKLPRKK